MCSSVCVCVRACLYKDPKALCESEKENGGPSCKRSSTENFQSAWWTFLNLMLTCLLASIYRAASSFDGRGQKIQQLLRASGGDMSKLELTIKKTLERKQQNKIEGEYVTELDLQNKGWDSEMIEKSKQWAMSKGLHRTSEIHGKEEWKIPLRESFDFTHTQTETAEATGAMDVEDRISDKVHIVLAYGICMHLLNLNCEGPKRISSTIRARCRKCIPVSRWHMQCACKRACENACICTCIYIMTSLRHTVSMGSSSQTAGQQAMAAMSSQTCKKAKVAALPVIQSNDPVSPLNKN